MEAARGAGGGWARACNAHLCSRLDGDGYRVLQPALWPFVGKPQFSRARIGLAHLCGQRGSCTHIPARTRGASPLDCGLAGSVWRGPDGGLKFWEWLSSNANSIEVIYVVEANVIQTTSSSHSGPDRGRESGRVCRWRTAPVLPPQDSRCERRPPWWRAIRSRSNRPPGRLAAKLSLAWAGAGRFPGAVNTSH